MMAYHKQQFHHLTILGINVWTWEYWHWFCRYMMSVWIYMISTFISCSFKSLWKYDIFNHRWLSHLLFNIRCEICLISFSNQHVFFLYMNVIIHLMRLKMSQLRHNKIIPNITYFWLRQAFHVWTLELIYEENLRCMI